MEDLREVKSVSGLVVGILLISVIGGTVLLLIFRAISIPSYLRSALTFLIMFVAIYPLMRRWPNKPGQRPLTFWRWMLPGLAGAVTMFAANYLFDLYSPDR